MKDVTKLRLQLLANGYSPIRNRDKRTFMKDWPTTPITPEEIERWDRRFSKDTATGLRIENGLCAIDLDIDDDIIDKIAQAIFDAIPALAEPAPLPTRRGKGRKEAWFVRTEEPFGRIFSHGWIKPGETADMGVHRVEIFGGANHRQFGAFGPHTVDDSGNVLVEYLWDGPSPADVPLDMLPMLTKQDCFEIARIVSQTLRDAGWQQALTSKEGEGEAHRVYDLVESMTFDCSDEITRTLDELRVAAAQDNHLRCSASFLEGDQAINRQRCLVGLTKQGGLAIYETAEGVTHCELSQKPETIEEKFTAIDRIGEKLKERQSKRRNKITSEDDLETTVAKMLQLYAFCPSQQNPVVPVWATSPEQGYTLGNARAMFLPNAVEEIGPRGGVKLINPLDVWQRHPQRKLVEGLRMRPDQERPLYVEDGRHYINIYDPPAHLEIDGEITTVLAFFKHLIPNAVERTYFIQWLAFKLRFPHIPGPAIVMVAHRTQGTGRGTLARLLGKLFGDAYVHQLPFTTFTGKTYQSQYNDWMATALVAVVNESSETTDGSSTYQTKRNTYEHLKEMVDPRPLMRLIMLKGRANYRALSCTSFLICTNNADALPIPADDRRFVVIQNGGTQSPDYWQHLNDWIDAPRNIGALAEHLLNVVDLAGYDPFGAAPAFEGKLRMIDESKSELDVAIDEALASLVEPVFVIEQIEALVKREELPNGVRTNLKTLLTREIKNRCYRIGIRDGQNWKPMIDGKRYGGAYALTAEAQKHFTNCPAGQLRDAIVKNGTIGSSNVSLLGRGKGA